MKYMLAVLCALVAGLAAGPFAPAHALNQKTVLLYSGNTEAALVPRSG